MVWCTSMFVILSFLVIISLSELCNENEEEYQDKIHKLPIPTAPTYIYNTTAVIPPEYQLSTCDQHNSKHCYIDCDLDNKLCQSYTWTVQETTNIESITIICTESEECLSLSIFLLNANQNTLINNITILCEGDSSCKQMNIFFDLLNEITRIFNIHCIAPYACFEMSIKQSNPLSYGKNELNVYCYDHRSCSELNIAYIQNTTLNLHMFEGYRGEYIYIRADPFESVNVYCGNDEDELYFLYNIASYQNDEQLIEIAREKYSNDESGIVAGGGLPCEGIEIVSHKPTYEYCKIEYELSDYYDIDLLLETGVECYWMEVNKLIEANCNKVTYEDSKDNSTLIMVIIILASVCALCCICMCLIKFYGCDEALKGRAPSYFGMVPVV